MVRLRRGPAGADEIGIIAELALGEVVGRRHRGDVDGLLGGRHRRERITLRRQHAADQQLHVIFEDQLLGLGHRGIRLGLAVLDDEVDLGAGEVAVDLVEVHFEAVGHVGADLGERAGHRRDQADAQFFLSGRGRKSRRKRETGSDQHHAGSPSQLARHGFTPLARSLYSHCGAAADFTCTVRHWRTRSGMLIKPPGR